MAYSYVPDTFNGHCPSCNKKLVLTNYRYIWQRCEGCAFPFVLGWLCPVLKRGWLEPIFAIDNPTGCHHCHHPVPYGAEVCFQCGRDLISESKRWPLQAIEHLVKNIHLWRSAKFLVRLPIEEWYIQFSRRSQSSSQASSAFGGNAMAQEFDGNGPCKVCSFVYQMKFEQAVCPTCGHRMSREDAFFACAHYSGP